LIQIRIGSEFNGFAGSGFAIRILILEGKNDPQERKKFRVLMTQNRRKK
jgi:hypothetical protein